MVAPTSKMFQGGSHLMQYVRAIYFASLVQMGVALAVGERADTLFHNGRGYERIVWAGLIFISCNFLCHRQSPSRLRRQPPLHKGANW